MKTLVFDFDGVLMDSMPYWGGAMLQFLKNNATPYPADVIRQITPLGNSGAVTYFQKNLGLKKDLATSLEEIQAIMFPQLPGHHPAEGRCGGFPRLFAECARCQPPHHRRPLPETQRYTTCSTTSGAVRISAPPSAILAFTPPPPNGWAWPWLIAYSSMITSSPPAPLYWPACPPLACTMLPARSSRMRCR